MEQDDELVRDGITALAEGLASQLFPDDVAKQALIVEAYRSMQQRRVVMAPGTTSPFRFAPVKLSVDVGPGTEGVLDLHNIAVNAYSFLFQADGSLHVSLTTAANALHLPKEIVPNFLNYLESAFGKNLSTIFKDRWERAQLPPESLVTPK